MTPAPPRLVLLGQLELWRGDLRLEFPPSKKTRALLAYLASSRRAHRRDRLSSLLWDVADDPKAALRWSLSKLRALVDDEGAPRIIADRETVRFDPAGAFVDVLEVGQAVGAPLSELPTARLEQLVALFRGPFLEGLDLTDFSEFHAWCVAERERWRSTQERLLRALVDARAPEPEAALSTARELVGLCPGDESARSTLVRLLFTTGRRDEAEEHHRLGLQDIRRTGIAPTGELTATWRSLVAAPAPAGPAEATSAPPAEPPRQTIRFCTAADGARIAYATMGRGPPLLKAANWLTHIEYDWKSPIWRHLARDLAQHYELVRYDQRGNGLSDWNAEFSFDAFVKDLEAVADAAGLDRFALLGISQGTRTAVAYAVSHPERVSRLILYGGSARGWRQRAPDAVERRQALATLMRHGWGEDGPAFRQVFSNLFMPEASSEQIAWFNELQRVACSAENAVRISEATASSDLTHLLPRVGVPTLVMHATHDAMVPFDEARRLAAEIPGARFVALESQNHLLLGEEPAWQRFVSEIRDFLSQPDD